MPRKRIAFYSPLIRRLVIKKEGGDDRPPSFFIIYVDYNARNVKSLGFTPRLFIFIRI